MNGTPLRLSLFAPFTRLEALIFTQKFAKEGETYRPFSCRIYTNRHEIKWVTVTGILMGTPTEDPILLYTDAAPYFDRLERARPEGQLRKYYEEKLAKLRTATLAELIVECETLGLAHECALTTGKDTSNSPQKHLSVSNANAQ
jgi:hypothetical protein